MDPDLVTLGKIVGGGLPVGVFGGKREYMDLLAPLGPVYQAGTLSGNPLAMAAGTATLGYLQEHAGEVYPRIEATSKAVFEGVAAEASEGRHAADHQSRGRDGHVVLHAEPGDRITTRLPSRILATFGRFHRAMLEQGVWLPPSQFEAAFLGTAHGEARSAGDNRGSAHSVQG